MNTVSPSQALDIIQSMVSDPAKRQAALRDGHDIAGRVQEVLAVHQAKIFMEIEFPFHLKKGISLQLGREIDPVGKMAEPGARKAFLQFFKGLIPIYSFEERFEQGCQGESFKVPLWLSKVIGELNEAGWGAEAKEYVHVDFGIGNTRVGYLCIKDPRVSDVSG